MPQIIMKPEDLDQFAKSLREFNNELGSRIARLESQFAGLGETWRDQEHAKFAEEFRQTMRSLRNFMKAADQQIPFLKRKAQRGYDIQNQR